MNDIVHAIMSNNITHAVVGALLVLYAPLQLIAVMRCIVNWNRAVYVRYLFREATYSNDPDNKQNVDELSWSLLLKFPFMSYFVLMTGLSHFIKYLVMKLCERPLITIREAVRKVGCMKVRNNGDKYEKI